MAHFAKIVDGIVTQVIVAEPDFFVNESPSTWLQTSYNTIGNKHVNGGTPLRGNFAGIGYSYDAGNDVFYAPQPFSSWVLNSDYLWEAPIPMPNDGKVYIWDQLTLSWFKTEN
jgi:hypothetical protein